METIKIGEHVRTHKGKIYKVTNVYVLKVICGHTSLRYNTIKKHNPNILYIIEKDDYVNGCRVFEVKEKGVVVYLKIENGCTTYDFILKEDIKSIVTKEQFNSIKYVIGG